MIFIYMMQPLTPHTVHITPPDDDYVARATSPTLDKQLNEFEEECSDITRVTDKANVRRGTPYYLADKGGVKLVTQTKTRASWEFQQLGGDKELTGRQK
ncbi:hypothetical protein Tco_1250343 [Tanacetum coccineum]